MTPFHFGFPSRPLLGIHHAPAPGTERGRCVLLCNPFGQEAIRSHRLFKLLADRLCNAGFHVMRFDYYGTGDSAGEDGEGNLGIWGHDILHANEELLSRSGCRTSSLFGLRLGGTLAAIATRQSRTPVDQLVMWEPILAGTDYLAELFDEHERALQYSYGIRWHFDKSLRVQIAQNTGQEALGFAINATLRRQLGDINDGMIVQAIANATVAFCLPDDAPKVDRLRQRIATDGDAQRFQFLPSPGNICWTADEMMDASVAPVDMLSSIMLALKATA